MSLSPALPGAGQRVFLVLLGLVAVEEGCLCSLNSRGKHFLGLILPGAGAWTSCDLRALLAWWLYDSLIYFTVKGIFECVSDHILKF